MNPSSENNSFTASDIERYHSGKMSASERHALEKAALDDPFLADALEGYSFTATAADDVKRLRERLKEKTGSKKPAVVIGLQKWLRVAALVVIMAGAGWIAYQSFSPRKSELAIQQRKNQATDKSTRAADETVNLQTDSITSGNSEYLMPEAAARGTGVAVDAKKQTKEISEELKGRTPGIVIQSDNQYTREFSGSDSMRLNNSAPALASAESTNNRTDGEVLMNRNNRAAFEPSANNGNYRRDQMAKNKSRDLPPAANQLQMDTSAVRISGYIGVDKQDTLRNMDVVLKKSNDPPPEEMIFEKDSAKTAAALMRKPFVVIDTLEPAEGYARFDDYIANNLKMPEELKFKPVAGVVELLFDVNNNGDPVNITVVKSLCNKCDEEAIRLLKEGPKWKKKKNKKGKISIRFN